MKRRDPAPGRGPRDGEGPHEDDEHAPYLGERGRTSAMRPIGGLVPLGAGKVRDLYELDRDHLVFVTTDRVSAFDVVMAEGVPHKGRVLTHIAAFWFRRTADLVPNHLVSTRVEDLPGLDEEQRAKLRGRVLVVRRTVPTPVEWVVRAYLAGSGLAEYRRSGALWGQPLPPGLELASRLPEPLLTPTTKDEAKDVPLTLEQARAEVGDDVFDRCHAASLAIFRRATGILAAHGLLLADTKFEFGLLGDGELLLIDEALTPDSSRLWPADSWRPGVNPPSYDKQILRDHLEASGWPKKPPPPPLPRELLDRLGSRYLEFARLLTGEWPEGVPTSS
jgi:phosphoribosylaminoimidazole-succinocarboxamide synthase